MSRRSKLPLVQVLLLMALLTGVLASEAGLREPAHAQPFAQPAAIGVPGLLEPVMEQLRSSPFRYVADPDRAAVVSGVVFGRTDRISEADRDSFLRSGLWHLLAASGQNVALVAGMCIAAAWLAGGGRLLGVAWALIAVPLYVAAVGGGPSIVRAGIMGELALVAWLAGRLRDVWHAMLLSAVLMTWAWPGVHRSLGFQLSYACVMALLLWGGAAARQLRQRGLPGGLAEGVAATVVCSAATAPLLMARTGSTPALGAVANLLAVPIASGVLVIGLTGALVALVWSPAAVPLFAAAGWGAEALLRLARIAAGIPLAQVESWTSLLVATAAATAGWGWRRGTCQARRAAVVAACIGLALAASAGASAVHPRHPPPPPGHLRVAFIDVGQGDAILLQAAGTAVLVDTGPPGTSLARDLRSFGVSSLTGIVATHDQLDHVGNMAPLVARFSPAWVARPPGLEGDWSELGDLPVPVSQICAGHELDVGSASVSVVHPPCSGHAAGGTSDPRNDAAAVLLVTAGKVDIALTADAEAPVTTRLGLPRVELLKVAHHGSADAQLPQLLRQTRPLVAVIPVGSRNRFGHPSTDVLAALADAGVQVYRTDHHGTVSFLTDGTSIWREPPRGWSLRDLVRR